MTTNCCVVVCAGGQARLFTLEPAELPDIESGPNLIPRGELQSESAGEHSGMLWSEVKTGRNRAPNGGSHGYDDHRDRHADEFERRFAREVAAETRRLVDNHAIHEVLLVAHDRCLANLRTAFQGVFPNGTVVREVAKDLTKLRPQELHTRLAREHLLPERSSPRRLA